MASWDQVAAAAPALARRVGERFSAHRHSVLATVRRDGSPRLTGVETQFVLGHLWMGMMGGSRKARDLLRDPRMALHSAPDAPELGQGDARITGRASLVEDDETIAAWAGTLNGDPPGPFHLFRVDVAEISVVTVEGDHLVIESWRDGRGSKRVERR